MNNIIAAQQILFFIIELVKTFGSLKIGADAGSGADLIFEHTAKIATLIDKIAADGKIGIDDIPDVIAIVREFAVFINFDFNRAAQELSNASKADIAELLKKFDDAFTFHDKAKEKLIETLINEVFTLLAAGIAIADIVKKMAKT